MFTKNVIESYYSAFKNEQLFLMVLGAVALIIAVVFYAFLKTNWYKGFALPLAAFALLNVAAGFSHNKKTDALKVRNVYNYDLHPELLRAQELPRIKELNQYFTILIYVNISIIFAAIFIFIYFKKKDDYEHYKGVAASLILIATISVVMYSVMKKRSENYELGIIDFTKEIKTK